jgi:cysteine desulfurase
MNAPLYLDHNATTPLDPRAFAAMEPYFREAFGNPSSVEHHHGNAAAVAVERAREQVARAISARPSEIILTGSCTEANNLAILGAARAQPGRHHIVVSQVEHPSALECARALEVEGHRVSYLPVDEFGRVSVAAAEEVIGEDTAIVSVMAANNEVGTLQPIRELGALCEARGALFHTDAAQLLAYGELDVERDHVHLASISGHKAYGPKGVGALYVRSRRPRARLSPLIYGGGQERGLRSGTLNVPAIVGLGAALDLAANERAQDSARLLAMCHEFKERVLAEVPGAVLNGHPAERLPQNLSFSISGVEPLALIRRLNEDMSFSASSACSSDKVETSHVLKAMFGDAPRARQAFRIAPGRFTTAAEMERASVRLVTEARRLLGLAEAA